MENKVNKSLADAEGKALEVLKEKGLTVEDTLKCLDLCKSYIMTNMPLKENLKSKFTW